MTRFALAPAGDRPVEELIEQCRELGLDAIDVSWPGIDASSADALRDARRGGIQTTSIDLGPVGDLGEVTEQIDEILRLAADTSCRRLLLTAASVPGRGLDEFVAGLQNLADRLEPQGIALVVRAATAEEAPRGLLRSTADLRIVLGRVNRGNVSAQANLTSFGDAAEDGVDAAASLVGRLGHASFGIPASARRTGYDPAVFVADLAGYGYGDVVSVSAGDSAETRKLIDEVGGSERLDQDRIDAMQSFMDTENLNAIVLCSSENVLSLSGYWPMNGTVVAIVPRQSEPHMLVPAGEETWASRSGWPNIHVYQAGRIVDPAFADSIDNILTRVAPPPVRGGTVGIEGPFRAQVPPHMAHEVSGRHEVLRTVIADSLGARTTFLSEQFTRTRAAKTERELRGIRRAAAVADVGLRTFRDGLAVGKRDIDLATEVEAALERFGVGNDGVTRARGYAFVMSGPQTSQTHLDYEFSSARRQRAGDAVLMEMAVVADGYWQDLSRVFVLGEPSAFQTELHTVAEAAFQAAVAAAVPGATGEAVDQAAREVVQDGGLTEAFPHQTGHGVGVAFHEQYPLLKPGSGHVLEAGNVIAIEPGVYIPGLGGVRNEDNLIVGDAAGARSLQAVPHQLSVPART
jgi:Xaa-Pro aminopeptidase